MRLKFIKATHTVSLPLFVFLCFQSDSFAMNDTQLSTIPLDEFVVERESETQFQEPPAAAAAAGHHDQG